MPSPAWLVRESIINLIGEGFRLKDNEKSVKLVLDDLRDVMRHNEQAFDQTVFEPHVRELLSDNLSLADLRQRQVHDS